MSSIQLTPAERREMKRLGKLVDPATEADRLFFECRLDRQHRARLASQAEIDQHELIDGKPPAVPPGFQPFVAVRNVARGARMRLSLPAPEGSETDVCEATARAILEAPATAYTWEIEAAIRKADVFPLRHWPLRSRGGDEHEDKTAATLRRRYDPAQAAGVNAGPPTSAPDSGGRVPHSSQRTSRRTTSRAAFVSGPKGELQMSKDEKKIDPLADDTPDESSATDSAIPPEIAAELDVEEKEFRALRRDLPGVKGSSAAGIVTLSVGPAPAKNEFFRTHPDFRPVVPLVNIEVGMEKQYFAVTSDMIEPLKQIGITVSDHTLYLTVTTQGAVRIVPIRTADDDGNQDEYTRTKEIGLIQGMQEWFRLYTDRANKAYKVFPAPAGRFGEPQFPDLTHAKTFRLGFRDKGRLLDSTEHPLFLKWAARDTDK